MTTTTRLAMTCAAIAAALGALTGTASASFRGRDGQIALTPTSGNGVLLVGANGRHPHRICAGNAACRGPSGVRWSPDGRQLAVTRPDVVDLAPQWRRWALVYADGSCANCVSGGTGRAAFTASPGVLTATGAVVLDAADRFQRVRSDGRPLVNLDDRGRPLLGDADSRDSQQPKDDVSDAVWSSQGLLAVVVPGQIKAGRPGHLRAVGAGTSPSWSPNGRRLAVAYDGWIVVRPLHGRSTRLVRGTSPAWSPDGRSIAYLDARHTLRIITLATHHIRIIHGVHGRSIDWGPKPPNTRPPCTVAPGSHTVLSTPTALVTEDWPAPDTFSTYAACLTATGRTQVLTLTEDPEDGGVAAVAGSLVAVGTTVSEGEHYSTYTERVQEWDLRTGASRPGIVRSCNGDSSCAMHGDQLVIGADGVLAIHLTTTWYGPGSYLEEIVTRDGSGVETRDSVWPEIPPVLTDLTLTGDTLSWNHAGTPETVVLTPPAQ